MGKRKGKWSDEIKAFLSLMGYVAFYRLSFYYTSSLTRYVVFMLAKFKPHSLA